MFSSYNEYLQAQTLPSQVRFSGFGNVCTDCDANRNFMRSAAQCMNAGTLAAWPVPSSYRFLC
jgi:hypothetical protein